MDLILQIIDFILHVDEYLNEIIAVYGAWTLALLFLIIFLETGFVVTPFLPGDFAHFCSRRIRRPRCAQYLVDIHFAFGRRHCRRHGELLDRPPGRSQGVQR